MRNSAGGGVSPPASAIRTATFDRRVGSLSGQALPPTGTAARVPRSPAFRFLRCRGPALRYLRCPPRRWRWGFAALEAGCRRVGGVSWF